MNCCTEGDIGATAVTAPRTGRSWLRRSSALVEWAVPITALALVPKCPACFAAYILLFTGVGLSFPAATAVRWAIIVLSVTALAYLLLRGARRALMRNAGTPP